MPIETDTTLVVGPEGAHVRSTDRNTGTSRKEDPSR